MRRSLAVALLLVIPASAWALDPAASRAARAAELTAYLAPVDARTQPLRDQIRTLQAQITAIETPDIRAARRELQLLKAIASPPLVIPTVAPIPKPDAAPTLPSAPTRGHVVPGAKP